MKLAATERCDDLLARAPDRSTNTRGGSFTRDGILTWIDECVAIVCDRFPQDIEVHDLLDSFLTQYDLSAIRLMNRNWCYDKVNHLRRSMRNVFRPRRKNLADISLSADPFDFVVWPFQPSHVDVLYPIYERLLQSSLTTRLVCHNPGTFPVIRSRTEHGVLLDLDWQLNFESDPICRAVVNSAKSLESIEADGHVLRFRDVLRESLRNSYGLYHSTRQITERIINNVRPKGILVGNDLTLAGRITCRLAHRNAIPTFSVMHGSIDNKAWKHGCSTRFFVFGESDRRHLMSWGVEKQRVIVTGSPKLESAKQSAAAVGLPDSRCAHCVLVATSGPGHKVSLRHHQQIVGAITEVADKLGDVYFVAKLHRKDRVKYYKRFDKLANTLVVPYGSNAYSSSIYDWLVTADVLLTAASGCALDAIAVGKPALTIDLTGVLSEISFIAAGATLHSRSSSALVKNIRFVIDGRWSRSEQRSEAQKYARNRYARPQSGATEKILDEIAKVLEARSNELSNPEHFL